MVKAGRKTLSCPRRQVQNQMEEDNEDFQPQDDTQSPSQPQPEGGAKSPGQPQAQASGEASPSDEKQGETPMETGDTQQQNQEAEDCPSRSRPPAARALWKPIPQIQPQPPAGQWKPIPPLEPQNSPGEPETSASTRNQSCQTEEQPPQSSPGGHAHSLGYCIEPGDPPLFQQPLQTSKSGIQQIIECFRSGTCELKHMLLKEVDTIFECKLCRSLFRGLPNLITHKEYYCLRRMPETDGDDRQSAAIRDLLEAIYPRKDRPDHVVRLEPIETSNKAVFQYLSTEDELNRYPAHTASNRQSPVAWGELEDGGSEPQQQQQSQQGPSEGPGSSFQSSQSYSQAERRRREGPADEEAPEEAMQAEEDGSTSGVEDVTISCCLCGKDFNSRRSIRRHCRKEHQTKLEELRKFTETRTVPTSLLSLVKGRPRTLTTPTGKSCPVCYKNFATKANVRRHFDEVHRGLRRDTITPEIATRPGQLLTLEATPPKKPAAAGADPSSPSSPTRCTTPVKSTTSPVSSAKGTPPPPTPQGQNKGGAGAATAAADTAPKATAAPYNLSSCRCLLCKRTYSSQVMLKRHMGIVHKMYNLKNGGAAAAVATATSPSSQPANSGASAEGVRVKQEVEESSDDEDEDDEEEEEDAEEDTESSSSASASPSDRADTPPRKGAATSPAPAAAAPTKGPAKGVKVKTEEQAPPPSPKSSSASSSSSPPPAPAPRAATTSTKAPKLSVGFDFKQLFCKLCKRQFSSRQNLTKHIELHTDGTDIFIKFYRCPLCRYESRRKRDVLRHVTVVHKKSSSYLAKIMPNLESRAVKRSAESVLNNSSLAKKISTAVEAATSSSSSGGGGGAKKEVNGRNASSSSGPPSPPSPPVTRKQDQQSSSSSSGATSSGAAAPAATTTTTSSSSSSSSSSTAPSSSKTLAPSPPVTRKQERQQRQRSCSPPLTRRSDKFAHLRQHDASSSAAHTRRSSEAESGVSETHSSEVKVTKNFSLHACDQCGRAFAKKLYLESHKRSHRNAAAATENRRKGINTRSKSLLW